MIIMAGAATSPRSHPYCILFYRYSGDIDPALSPSQRAIAFIRKHEPDSEPLLLEPRYVYDDGLIGVTDMCDCDQWSRATNEPIFIYDSELCIQSLVRHGVCETRGEDVDVEAAAADYFYYNCDAWVGKGTPTFTNNWDEGRLEKAVRDRLRRLRHKLYFYTRAVGMFLAAGARAKDLSDGQGGAAADGAAKKLFPPPPKRRCVR